MTYGAEVWNVKTNEENILRRTERAMLRKICGVKLADRKSTDELIERLGLGETVVEVVRRCGLRWMGHVLRRNTEDPIRRAWNIEVDGRRGRGRPKMTWKEGVSREARKIGLKEVAL